MPPQEKIEILYGYHCVREALKAGRRICYQVLVSRGKTGKRNDFIRTLAQKYFVPVKETDSKTLDTASNGGTHQGVVLEAGRFPLMPASRFKGSMDKTNGALFVLVLETMEDPHNMGALIRTALCAGADAVFIPKDRTVPPSPAVSRSSAGAMEHTDIYVMTNTAACLQQLKESGVWVGGLDAAGDTPLYDADMTGPFALVVGSEHKGIRPLVKKQCDFLITLPVKGPVGSLNASVAGGIAMYEVVRQRKIHAAGVN